MNLNKSTIQKALDAQGTVAAQGSLSSFMKTPPASGAMRFLISPASKYYVHEIIARCNDFAMMRNLPSVDEFLASLDLFAAHSNDCPIDFEAMHACPDIGEVMQFIADIGLRIDRTTGRLSGGWRGKFHVIAS